MTAPLDHYLKVPVLELLLRMSLLSPVLCIFKYPIIFLFLLQYSSLPRSHFRFAITFRHPSLYSSIAQAFVESHSLVHSPAPSFWASMR